MTQYRHRHRAAVNTHLQDDGAVASYFPEVTVALSVGRAHFLIPSVAVVFVNMFLLARGMFLIHTAAPGYLNSVHRENSRVVNGIYLMVYYIGGALGTYVPAMIYMQWGWAICILFLALTVWAAITVVAWILRCAKDNAV